MNKRADDGHPRANLGAFVLDALEGPDMAAVREHLEACAACSAEAGELAEVAATLALSAPQAEPSTGLRIRILNEARRAHTPIEDEASPVPAAAPIVALSSSDATADSPASGSAAGAPIEDEAPSAVSGALTPPKYRRPFPWANVSGAVAAAVAVVAMWWGMTQQARIETLTTEIEQLSERTARYDFVVRVLAAPGFQDRNLITAGAGAAWGRVYFDSENGRGMLMVHNLPRLPDGKTYQVWLNREGKRVSAAFLRTDDKGFGYTILRVDDPIGSYQTLGVTQEPEGGSDAPSGPPLVRAELRPL